MPSEWGIWKISGLQLHLGQIVILGMPSSRGITLDINPLGPTGYSMALLVLKNLAVPKCHYANSFEWRVFSQLQIKRYITHQNAYHKIHVHSTWSLQTRNDHVHKYNYDSKNVTSLESFASCFGALAPKPLLLIMLFLLTPPHHLFKPTSTYLPQF